MAHESVSVTPFVAPPNVSASVAAFLRGLIDYAGLFPPASLPLADAVTRYAAYRHTDDAWILGRLIVPAARLGDLDVFTDLFSREVPLAVAALGAEATSREALLRALAGDLEAIARFDNVHGGRARADVLELRLPPGIVEAGSPALDELLLRAAEMVDRAPVRLERLCLEVGFAGDWRHHIAQTAEVVARMQAAALPLALKLRCGGPSPEVLPTPEQVAYFLRRAREARLPFKATAGLHHPVRHFDRKLEVMQHGFFNVFGAALLAHALDLTEAGLRQVLRSDDPGKFVFDDDGFAFQDLRIATAQIEAARLHFALSFGSCSFDEPREDLRAAGLL